MWLLIACTDEAWVDVEPPQLADPEDLPERARLRAVGEARLTEDGDALSGEPGEPDPWLIVADPGERVQIVTEERGLRLLLWLDREDLVDVLYEWTWATATPGGDEATGARLPAGLPIEGWAGPDAAVQWEGDVFAVDGWVPRSAVDQVWAPGEAAEPIEADEMLVGGDVVRDAPGGSAIARLSHDTRPTYVANAPARVLERRDGWRLVEVEDGGVLIRGWVEEPPAELLGLSGWGWSRCGGVGWHEGAFIGAGEPSLLEGDFVRASPGGPVVGVATRDLWVDVDEHGAFEWETEWGVASLWIG